MLGRGHWRPVPETVARWVPVPLWWRPGVGIVHVLLLASEGMARRQRMIGSEKRSQQVTEVHSS